MALRFLESFWTSGIQGKLRVFRTVKITFLILWSMELCAVGGYSRLEANFESVNKGRISTVCTLNMEVSVDCMVSSSRMLLYDINLMFHLIWILVSFFKGDGE